MERKPDSANGIFKVRKIPYWVIRKLGRGQEANENSKRDYEKAVVTNFIQLVSPQPVD